MKQRRPVLGFVLMIVALVAVSDYGVSRLFGQTPQALSDSEKLRLENLNLKQQLAGTLKTLAETQGSLGQCQAQINAGVVSQDARQLKLDLEGARPGWVYDFEKRTFVKKPEDKKDPPK